MSRLRDSAVTPATRSSPATDADAAERSRATAELVLEIATAASGERELEPILRVALDHLGKVVPFTGGSIAVIESDVLIIRAAVGPFEQEALGQRLGRGLGRSWQVIDRLEPAIIDDVQAEGARPVGERSAAEMRSWLAVPIVRTGQAIGLLEIDSTEPHAFTAADASLVNTIGRALAGPIELAARYDAERRAGLLREAFIGVISHELRTPITTIYGMSRVLRQRIESLDPDERVRMVGDIEAEADRLRRLVEDLLVLSRAEGGQIALAREPVLVAHVIRRTVAAEAGRWPDHELRIDVSRDLPVASGEETYVEQVLQNLLTNATKYSAPGSEVRVEGLVEDNEVVVRVLDRGIGLPDGANEAVFELFYRAPGAIRTAPGAGIGLFVCRQLVEAMGGRIWALPRPGGGSEFGFSLPVHAESDGSETTSGG
ncbi:MAG: ATP-binding protein [Chloroflexota bacterium]